MSSTAPIPVTPQDPTPTQTAPASSSAGPGTSQAPSTQGGSDSDLRLVIEDDKAAGTFVYMTINAATGEVVSQVPREQLLKMMTDPTYKPGSVVNSVG
jgi:flagellar protein FlaG